MKRLIDMGRRHRSALRIAISVLLLVSLLIFVPVHKTRFGDSQHFSGSVVLAFGGVSGDTPDRRLQVASDSSSE